MSQPSSFLGSDEPTLITPTSDEKTLAVLSHILCLLVGFIAPLVIYLVKKDESAYVRAHARESLNFQLTVIVAYIISAILMVVLIGFALMFLIYIGALILVIIATIRASENKIYKYPFSIRFVK